MALYKVIDRDLVFQCWLDVPEGVHCDSWLHGEGYDRSHTLRRGKIIEITASESSALHRAHDQLKARGLLPNALDSIANRLRA